MITLDWNKLSDFQKNTEVALRIADYDDIHKGQTMRHTKWGYKSDGPLPDYINDANLLIPLLQQHYSWQASKVSKMDNVDRICVKIANLAWWMSNDHEEGQWQYEATARTFQEAAMVALLRAKEITVNT